MEPEPEPEPEQESGHSDGSGSSQIPHLQDSGAPEIPSRD